MLTNVDQRGWSSSTTAQWQRIAQKQKPDRLKRHSASFAQNDSKRTAANSATNGQKVFEARHAIVRRYDEKSTSDKNSAYAALISNI